MAEKSPLRVGEGPARAEIMMVGERPGDAEDFAGHPFVGPAGKLARPGARRGQHRPRAPLVTATVHPSSILRAPDDAARREEMQEFVGDLKRIKRALNRGAAADLKT